MALTGSAGPRVLDSCLGQRPTVCRGEERMPAWVAPVLEGKTASTLCRQVLAALSTGGRIVCALVWLNPDIALPIDKQL